MSASDTATLQRERAAEGLTSTRRRRSIFRPRVVGVMLFAVFSAVYFTVGAVMILRYNLQDLDGPSRVASAGYAVMSRDPHLSAIGFVWNPLPSLTEIPLLPLSWWWPQFRMTGLASVVQSAVFMAGAVLMVRRIAIDRGLGTAWQWLAIAAFGLHPVIVIYGGSGMSEAAEIFCVLWATRYLLLWVKSRDAGHLAWVGIAMAVGYLARYEAVLCAAGIVVFVAAFTVLSNASGSTRTRWQRAVLNALIAGFPIAIAVTVWALTGWVTTGDLFATLSSTYGNSGQIAAAQMRGMTTRQSGNAHPMVIAARLLAMQPFVGVAGALAAIVSVTDRRVDPLIPVVTCGPILAFAMWGQFSGTTFGWFRFYILAIPLVIVVAMACWAPAANSHSRWQAPTWAAKSGATLLCVALLAFPVTARAMLNPDIGNQNLQFGWRSVLDPVAYPPEEQWYRQLRVDDRLTADYLDEQHLPNGSVLMDTFAGWSIWLYSNNPKQFVVTSDYDFPTALNRPWDNGIRYIMVSNPALNDAPDAISLRYPALWADGAGLGRLVYSAVGATGQERWRIYEVTPPPPDRTR